MNMRQSVGWLAVITVLLAYPSSSSAQIPPGFTEIIEINYTLGPGEMIDFVFVDAGGGVTQVSVGDPDGDGVITINVPPQAAKKSVHLPSCLYASFENPDLLSPVNGMVPLIADPTGQSLLPSILVTDLDQMPPLLIGQTFEVVNGVASEYRVAEIRAPGVPFDQILPSQWADPVNNFPLYTGTAFVSELLDTTVRVTCAKCPWDCADCDGVVGIVDFLALLAQWGGTGSCDFDGGGVGINDFLELLANWGACP